MINEEQYGELFRHMFEASAEGMVVISEDGKIITANGRFQKQFGYNLSDLEGQDLSIMIPEKLRKKHSRHLKDYFSKPAKRPMGAQMELYGQKKDGSLMPVEISLSYSSVNDQTFGFAYVVDISERKKIEESILENQERLDAIIQTATDGIITINEDGEIESINPAALKLFQYKEKDLLGQKVNTLMPEPYSSMHDEYMGSYQQTGKGKIIGLGREVLGKKKDGTQFPFHLSISEVKLKGRTLYTGIVHDVTEQKQAKEKLKKLNLELEKRVQGRTRELANLVNKLEGMNNELSKAEDEVRSALEKEKQLNELKSRFVSMASHEFRTPLSTILSSISLVEKYELPEHKEKKDKHINRIKSSVRNLTGILNDFLSLDKLESGNIDCNPSPFGIKELISEIIEELEPMLKKGQNINYNHTGPSEVVLDPAIMKNVIINLVSNAIKYSTEDKPIDISSVTNDTNLNIEVQDKGIGIPEEDKQHMFERFFRAKNVTNIQGTGLGLNIVKKYTELMKGDISFESEYEVGTKFKLEFPKSLNTQ